jgi:DNA-binding SARP family transcriptional activator
LCCAQSKTLQLFCPRIRRALCTYLALEAALLWPDILHESALTNLRQTLYRLRLAVEQVDGAAADTLLTINRQTIQINQGQ